MDNYIVSLERFYGPLDLLLYLVEKDEMNIYDISISSITDQYLQYIKTTEESEIEVDKMTDFLKMATVLLQLKGQGLLPAIQVNNMESEELDPREELIAKILLYRQFKEMASFLDDRQKDIIEKSFYRPFADLPEFEEEPYRGEKEKLAVAYKGILERKTTFNSLSLPFKDVRIEDKMEEILDKITQAERGELTFSELIKNTEIKREVTALFLALLELVREQKLTVKQHEIFDDIHICIRGKI